MKELKESFGWMCLIVFSFIAIWIFVTAVISTYESFASEITQDLNQQLPPGWI
jgi:hypothetical protein